MSADATDAYRRAARRMTIVWVVTVLALFAVMVVLGITMRLAQGGDVAIQPTTFYALMTMHGLGMAGGLFSGGLAAMWFALSHHARLSVRVSQVAWSLVGAGAAGLLAATLGGGYGASWYQLYPLPFVNAAWPQWSIGLTVVAMMLLGVGWLLLQLDMLRAIVVRHGLGGLLGLRVLAGAPGEALPPIVLIASVCAIAGGLGTVAGAAVMMLYLFQWLVPATTFDPLLLKNLMLFFGHIIVNVTMYCGIGVVYELLPSFTKQPWTLNKLVVVAWNATLLAILFAYFHHLFMDFVQPTGAQVTGQVVSYLSAVPATAVTIAGAFSQVHRSGIRWSFTPLAFYLGLMGWVVGGFAAVVDSTISVNLVFHNTLWVPGHFHTYFLVGFVFIFLGFAHWLLGSPARRVAVASLVMMLAGGYGFVMMFYLGGVDGVPRRYASYQMVPVPGVAQSGPQLATLGALFAALFLAGAVIFMASLAVRPRLAEAGEELAAGGR